MFVVIVVPLGVALKNWNPAAPPLICIPIPPVDGDIIPAPAEVDVMLTQAPKLNKLKLLKLPEA